MVSKEKELFRLHGLRGLIAVLEPSASPFLKHTHRKWQQWAVHTLSGTL